MRELQRAVWPTRGDTISLTIVVIGLLLLVGAVLGFADVGFGWLIDKTLLR